MVISGLRSNAVFGLRRPRLFGRPLELRRRQRRIELLDQLDLGLLQEAVELLDVGLVEIQLADCLGDLAVGEDTELAAAIREPLDLIKLLKIRY